MKKWLRLIYVSIRNTIVLIILLEVFLNLLFQYNDNRRYHKNVDFKIASNAYPSLNSDVVKELYDELYSLDSEWAPYVHFKLKEFKGKHYTINSNGIRRTTNFNLQDNNTPIKIFCFGGSTLLGTGARDAYTIPSRLSNYIHENFPKRSFEVKNFGCHGYNRSIENVQLQLELLAGRIPDIVIFYDGVNEIISAQENRKVGYPTNAANRQKEFKTAFSYSKKIGLLYSSSKIKRLVTYLQRKVFKTIPMEVSNPHILSEGVAQHYIKSLKITRALGNQYDFKIYNFLQPVIYMDKPLTEHEEIMVKDNGHFEKVYRNSYKNILENKELRKDSTFLDISNLFIEDPHTIYTDFCHIAERGNDSIAKKIFKIIQPSLENKEMEILE